MENQIICANCNSANSTKNLFCQNCGKPLTAARPAIPAIPVQPVSPISEPPIAPPPLVPTPPSFQPVSTSPQIVTPQVPPSPPGYPQTPSAPVQAVRSESSPAGEPTQVPPSQQASFQPPIAAKPMGDVARLFSIPQISLGAKIQPAWNID